MAEGKNGNMNQVFCVIDIQNQLDRAAYVYGNKEKYEKLVPVVLNELKANKGEKYIFDFGHVKEINKDLVKAIADILKASGLKSNIHAAFASEEYKEAFRVLFPEKLTEYIILV